MVLVTGVGGDIGQSVIKCLKDTEYNLHLFGCDTDPFAAGRAMVGKFFQPPPAKNAGKYLDFIKKVLSKEKIGYVIPTTEIEIEFFDKHRDCFKNVTTVLINEHRVIGTFLDKYETIKFLRDNDISHPETYLVESYTNELECPFILKPRRGCGGKDLILVSDYDEFNFLKKTRRDFIVQEIVGGEDDEYTITVFSTGKEFYSIGFRRYLGYGSLSKIAHLVKDDEIRVLAEKIVKATSLEGSLNIQCRKTDSGYIPFEVNPRFSSTVYTRHYFGFQDVKWWLDLKQGKNITYNPKFQKGTAVRTLGEVFFELRS